MFWFADVENIARYKLGSGEENTVCQMGAHSTLRQQSIVGEFVYILTSWRDF